MTRSQDRPTLADLTPTLYSRLTRLERRLADRYFVRLTNDPPMGGWHYLRRGIPDGPRTTAQLAYTYSQYAIARLGIPFIVAGSLLITLAARNALLVSLGSVFLCIEVGLVLALGLRSRQLNRYFAGDEA